MFSGSHRLLKKCITVIHIGTSKCFSILSRYALIFHSTHQAEMNVITLTLYCHKVILTLLGRFKLFTALNSLVHIKLTVHFFRLLIHLVPLGLTSVFLCIS
ncbi:hypothetical protein [Escherichia phage PGN6866]|nr:hypothetical protein [Escherichia phage PGN6866]